MSDKNRKKTGIERDRRYIARLYLQGELQANIGEQLGISQSTVSRDLTVIQKQWAIERVDDFNERKNIELAKVDNLELEYWIAWKRSLEDAETYTKKAVDAEGQNRREAQEQTKGQTGDPRFLTGIQWCINKRCELLGLDAPKKADLTSKGESLQLKVDDERFDRTISAFTDAIRENVLGKSTKSDGPVDTTK